MPPAPDSAAGGPGRVMPDGGDLRYGAQVESGFFTGWTRCGAFSLDAQHYSCHIAPLMKVLTVPSSGSQAGTTASRNRFGQYLRTRAVPVNPASAAQGAVRGRMSVNSAAWRALTAAQRAGWRDLGLSMVRSDALGQTYSLQGNQAYASVNNVRVQAGLAPVSDAPGLATPVSLLTVTPTVTAAAFSIAFTATPLGAGTYLFLFASPQRSAGRDYESDYRLIKVSAAAAASPLVALAEYTAKFGVPVAGNKIFLSLVTVTAGFQSGAFQTAVIVA
jgi:hypothetical protein